MHRVGLLGQLRLEEVCDRRPGRLANTPSATATTAACGRDGAGCVVEGEAGEAKELVPGLDRRNVPFDRGVQKELGAYMR